MSGAATLAQAALRPLPGNEGRASFYSLPALQEQLPNMSRLPISLRIVLESVLRNSDGTRITDDHVRSLANWTPNGARTEEIPFTVGRIVLNCAAGIPLLGDLTAIREALAADGGTPEAVQPVVSVDMALDHTMTVDFYGSPDAMAKNMALDVKRNEERYRFVKWALQAYDGIRLFPPGAGILHQLNLEFFAPGLLEKDGIRYPDTLVGTDSHTCMIAGLGSLGWGVGGIEAQAALLGQPIFFLTPDVVGVHVTGKMREGVTATDLVLHVTRMLREARVVGKFVEFFGPAVASLTVPDRATVANMAPEYGATVGYFPVDEQTSRYLRYTGREAADVAAFEAYYWAQGMFGAPQMGEVDYSQTLELRLDEIVPSLAGPKRPQDQVALPEVKERFEQLLVAPTAEGGYGKKPETVRLAGDDTAPADGSVVIAAITSCTNTSNPGVIIAAGLLARNAVARGMKTKPWVKTSLTPGSMVVGEYLKALGLQEALNRLGFAVAGYTCATCVGASGPLDPDLEKAIEETDAVVCAVLSGNRNFEARIHPFARASFLASPPLVVAYALAGRVNVDLASEPLGRDAEGNPVFLRDIWPSQAEVARAQGEAASPDAYRRVYGADVSAINTRWKGIPTATGTLYPWDPQSTYLRRPPFLAPQFRQSALCDVNEARILALLGNSVTTDHISPIGTIPWNSPAGQYLRAKGVERRAFNNYGSRRMNDEIMVRGGFSNVRLRNAMVPEMEGGFTLHQPSGEVMTIYDAACRYAETDTPLVIFAGEEYGTGSARDWAAKATRLLGVRAVIASSFERIHRSNLVGMGVLPCQLPADTRLEDLQLTGEELVTISGLAGARPKQTLKLSLRRPDGNVDSFDVILRIDTPAELDYALSGGIMPYLLRRAEQRLAEDTSLKETASA